MHHNHTCIIWMKVTEMQTYFTENFFCLKSKKSKDFSRVYVTRRSEQVPKLTRITQKQCLPLLDILVNAEGADTEMVAY